MGVLTHANQCRMAGLSHGEADEATRVHHPARGCGGMAARGARAQQPSNIPRIGFLRHGRASAYADRVEALQTGLRQLGYVEGKNIVIEFRWAETVDQLPELVADLVGMNVDVIFAMSSTEVEPTR